MKKTEIMPEILPLNRLNRFHAASSDIDEYQSSKQRVAGSNPAGIANSAATMQISQIAALFFSNLLAHAIASYNAGRRCGIENHSVTRSGSAVRDDEG